MASLDWKAGAAVTGGSIFALLLLAAPAQARLHQPGYDGPLSGGVFSGLPIRQETTARLGDTEMSGVASDHCYVVRQESRDRLGTLVVRTAQFCE